MVTVIGVSLNESYTSDLNGEFLLLYCTLLLNATGICMLVQTIYLHKLNNQLVISIFSVNEDRYERRSGREAMV